MVKIQSFRLEWLVSEIHPWKIKLQVSHCQFLLAFI